MFKGSELLQFTSPGAGVARVAGRMFADAAGYPRHDVKVKENASAALVHVCGFDVWVREVGAARGKRIGSFTLIN